MSAGKRITVSLHSDLLFATILVVSGIIPFIFISVASDFPATCQLFHEAFHAVMETLGCMMGLGIAGFLLMRLGEEGNEYKLWPACAMLSMAILGAFHASISPGREFVFLHSTAQFVGGVFIAMIWLPASFASTRVARVLPKVVAGACGLLGIMSFLVPEILPTMVNNGQFTFVPQFLNFAGGVLFLVGLAYFARRFSRDRENTHLLFTAYCLLFAVAGLTFRLSGLWGVGWWLSHILRLGAFVIAFGYVSINSAAEYLRLIQAIAERKRAEKELEQSNKDLELAVKDLEVANKELQSFAHIAAHDLKAPLRSIGTLAGWLSNDYADKFDEQGKENIELMAAKTKQMAALIDDILRYSKLGKEDFKREPVVLSEIVSAVIGEVVPENIEVSIADELPVLMGGKTHILQIFQNLIGNAVKYMDKPNGRIQVGCIEQDDFWQFSIADNGPGIERKSFEKIFQMFEKLKHRDGVDSTGIGLAIVKKLVELNCGTVWVESEYGEGSIFYFTLPKSCDAALTAAVISYS